jgi:hypothetical protein
MPRCLALLVLSGLVAFAMLPTARAEVDAEQLREALNNAINYLKREQGAGGKWPDRISGGSHVHPGGVTSLCTLALLNAGVKPDDKHVKEALKYIESVTPNGTYSTSLQIMALAQADAKRYQKRILDNVKILEKTQIKEGRFKGAWGYSNQDRASVQADNSNAQFAVLALHEAERAGVRVSDEVWRMALDYWLSAQSPTDGSWNYVKGTSIPPTGSMTCAGIASVIMCDSKLNPADARVVGGEVACCGQVSDERAAKAVERGIEWLGRRWSVEQNPVGRGPDEANVRRQAPHLYYLYALERVGRMTSRRFFFDSNGAARDWYREGADAIITKLQDKLSGGIKGYGIGEEDPNVATAFGLLFLSKGRRPVLAAKLKYGDDDNWDRHRHDLASLTSYTESKWKMDLNWQVVDLASYEVTVEDLLQTPVLWISGGNYPKELVDRKRAKLLRAYVDRGGFILAEACCSEENGFDRGFRELMEMVFPEAQYRLKPVMSSHPVWFAEEQVDAKHAPYLEQIDYGCRTSVIYAPPVRKDYPPGGLACYWELAYAGRKENLPAAVRADMNGALATGVNVMAYATNRELKTREMHFDDAKAKQRGTELANNRNTLYIAKLRHPGGCDAAPAALARIMEEARASLEIEASVEPRLIEITDSALFAHHMVFMHGRYNFRLTKSEREQLKKYVERGGLIFADSICASSAFDEAFRREMNAIFDKPLERVPANHAMFTKEFGGYDLATVTRRDPQHRAGDGPLAANKRKVPPFLEGIRVGDRYGVVYSKYDISCALEMAESLQCSGYIREDAKRIALNVLLYSLH